MHGDRMYLLQYKAYCGCRKNLGGDTKKMKQKIGGILAIAVLVVATMSTVAVQPVAADTTHILGHDVYKSNGHKVDVYRHLVDPNRGEDFLRTYIFVDNGKTASVKLETFVNTWGRKWYDQEICMKVTDLKTLNYAKACISPKKAAMVQVMLSGASVLKVVGKSVMKYIASSILRDLWRIILPSPF